MALWKAVAAFCALLGSALAVVSVAEYETYISSSLVGGISDTEMGFFAALAIVVAIVAFIYSRNE